MSRLWMVSYDIEDDRIRRRVHNLLKNYGERVQYSVFECWLQPEQQETLRKRLQAEIDTTDSLRWYPLCQWCQENVVFYGQGNAAKDRDYFVL